ncbi:MAG: hypothetical protein NTW19_08555, partial [Planctomycetota bacterium]|nr:hypothetical protein [Planctomycetota bacterium]
HRHWAIYAGKADAFPESAKQVADFYRWWTRRMMITLDKVSAWQLEWPGMDQIAFPHTFFDSKELPAIRKSLQAEPAVQQLMEGKGQWQLGAVRFTDLAARYLVSGDPALLPKLKAANEGLDYLDRFVKMFLDESGPLTDDQVGGMAVSDEMLKRCVGLDFLLGSDVLSSQEKHDILVKLAFMVYAIHDPFWMPPNHPFEPQKHDPYPAYVQGTPNQKHCYISARGIAESALTGHPMLPQWTAHTLEEYQRCLPGSVAPSGVHAESPFYSSRDTMRFGPFWRALTRAGVKGPVVDHWLARIHNTFEYMGDMTAPPDPRMANLRTFHPIGRSSTGVIDPTFIIGADAWADHDPAFASRMRWLWEQQGKPSPYILDTTGGRNISLTLLASVPMLQAKPLDHPPLVSRRWDAFGSNFRRQVASGFESNVHFPHAQLRQRRHQGGLDQRHRSHHRLRRPRRRRRLRLRHHRNQGLAALRPLRQGPRPRRPRLPPRPRPGHAPRLAHRAPLVGDVQGRPARRHRQARRRPHQARREELARQPRPQLEGSPETHRPAPALRGPLQRRPRHVHRFAREARHRHRRDRCRPEPGLLRQQGPLRIPAARAHRAARAQGLPHAPHPALRRQHAPEIPHHRRG